MNYQTAIDLAKRARDPKVGKKIDHNTWCRKDGDDAVVKLHATDILRFKPNGDIILNTGGWKTPTTKDRLQEFAPVWIWSDRKVWKVRYCGTEYLYADGMVLHADETVSGAGTADDNQAQVKLQKSLKKYCKGFITALYKGEVGMPGPGDCWYCSMREVGTGKPWGETGPTPRDHILAHLEEGYYVPSLLVRALEVGPSSIAAKSTASALMRADTKGVWDNGPTDFIGKQIEKCLKKYMSLQLGLPA